MIQLQGYSTEPLVSVRYDVANDAGTLTNEEGYVAGHWYDTNLLQVTTNWFECLDIDLTNGVNTITLRATDEAGNISTNIYVYTLDYSTDTNPPAVKLYWPQDGTQISGTNFTWRGSVDDFTAQLTVETVDTNGATNSVNAQVERNGNFWVEGLPLAEGTNSFTLTATDAAGNSSSTNINVVKSDVSLTIDDVPNDELIQPALTVYGVIDTTNYAVWVNGVLATDNGYGDGSWTAENVPANGSGTVVIQARAIPYADNGGNGTGGGGGTNSSLENPGNPSSAQAPDAELPKDGTMKLAKIHYEKSWTLDQLQMQGPLEYGHLTQEIRWDLGRPGHWFWDSCWLTAANPSYSWIDRNWNAAQQGTICSGSGAVCGQRSETTPGGYSVPLWPNESCEGNDHRVRLIDTPQVPYDEAVSKTAKTRYEVYTGGKSIPGQKSLFVFSASATGHGNLFWPELDDPLSGDNAYSIDPTRIKLGELEGTLGSDGYLYKALPDGKTYDVTPKVAGARYITFWVQPNKYPLTMTANGQTLDPDNTGNVQFCVGQRVKFELQFDKPLGFVDANARWTLPDKFVNQASTNSAGCVSYTKNSDLLKSLTVTNCWYANGQGGAAVILAVLHFSNGQYVPVAALGNFIVYRPSLTPLNIFSSGGLTLTTNVGYYTLRVDPAMGFLTHVDSAFSGIASFTQVYDDESYPTSYGSQVLDGAEFYPPGLATVITNNVSHNVIQVIDTPHENSNVFPFGSSVSLIVQFSDYARFKPDAGDPSQNIFVTL